MRQPTPANVRSSKARRACWSPRGGSVSAANVFQEMLDAAGVTQIDGLRLVEESVLAPAYLWAQFGEPLDPAEGTERLVDTVLSVAHRDD